MTIARKYQVAWIMLVGFLAAPLYGQAEESPPRDQPQRGGRVEQRDRPERRVERPAGQSPLTERQRALLADFSSAVHAVAESVQQSVVHVEVTDGGKAVRRPGGAGRTPRGGDEGDDEGDNDNSQLPENLRDFLRRFGGQLPPGFEIPEMPQERIRRGLGSGIVYDDKGHILTNNHVVGGAGRINVVTTDGREFDAKVVGTDPLTDVAVIEVKTKELKPAQFGDSSKMEVGDLVLAVGNPFGLDYSVTQGIISAVGRNRLQLGNIYYQDFLQTDAAINPGNSGGPLVNMDGQVIGLNTAIATQTGQYAGVGFSIPANMAQRIADILIEKGKVIRGWLGVQIKDLNLGMAESFKYPEGKNGVLVDYVVPDSPAEKAGFKRGDIIMRMKGQPVKNATQLQTAVTLTAPGEKVKFQVWRDEKAVDLEATLGELKESYLQRAMGGEGFGGAPGAPEKFESEELGVTVVTPTSEQAKKFGWTEVPKGALVINVDPAGEAQTLNIQPGDVIVSVQSQTIEGADGLREALKKVSIAEGFRMYVLSSPKRGGGGQYVYVQRG